MRITKTTIEYESFPIGIDVRNPRISWVLEDSDRDTVQSIYQIQVAEDKEFQNMIWDSKKVESDESILIPYEGNKLQSCTRYYYRIAVWNQRGEKAVSELGYWETAFLDAGEWQANWITPEYDYQAIKTACPVIRKNFDLKKGIKKGKVYVTAKGLYELRLNGKKVGEDYLTPGWTSYNKRHLYQIYDITGLLKEGNNGIGALIGSGWYKGEVGWRSRRNLYGGREALIMEMHVEYEDGTSTCIITDDTWKSSYRTPVEFAEIYHGETYNALKETAWDQPGFDDSDWFKVRLMGRVTKEVLKAQECTPVRINDIIKPVRFIVTPKGEKVLDMGQNMTGWIRFRVKGNAGDKVILQHTEMLDQEGNFYTDNLKGAKQRIEYTLKGKEEESFRPHFTYQGFRYVKIEAFPGTPELDQFEGLVLYSGLETIGSFECSDTLVNRLQHNLYWGQRGNFVDIPSDCPQRCERLGWTGDIQIFAPTAAFNMNVANFLSKWLRDLAKEQFPSGGVPWVVPDIYDDTYAYDLAGYVGQSEQVAAAWGDAATICPWTVYKAYGDKRILKEQYPSMKAYIEYIKNEGDTPYLWNTGHQLGDWVALDAPYGSFIGATDVEYVATAYYAYSTRILYRTAGLIGNVQDEKVYRELYDNILKAFQEEYVLADGSLKVKTQTAIILALYFELVDRKTGQGLADELAKWLKRTNYDLITGFVGTPYICHVLSAYGHAKTAYRMLLKKDYPSWLYQITKGATTIWEHLDGLKPDGTFWNPRMNSFNHYAYGSVGEWLYRSVAGLNIDEDYPGYKHFLVAPETDDAMSYAKASTVSMYGKVSAGWIKENTNMEVSVQVPVNTSATVKLPGQKKETIKESGCSLEQVKGIRKIDIADGYVNVTVGSGDYKFTWEV